MWSLSECIPWMIVGLAESVAIVIVNLCTIIVFIRNRNLRKRSTHLMINLAVIDMFAGGIGVYDLFYWSGVRCHLWKRQLIEDGTYFFIDLLRGLFPFGSLINITIIALERMHGTFFPFRHRVLKKWVYGLITAVVWVTSGLVSVSSTVLFLFKGLQYDIYLRFTFMSIFLLIICVSYTSIVIKVRCGTQPQHHGAPSRERKLTMTLLIVTVVSLLFYLPYVVTVFVIFISKSGIVSSGSNHLPIALTFLFYANSLANPILYAIRMPEYRSAFLALFRRQAQQQKQVAVLPLRNM